MLTPIDAIIAGSSGVSNYARATSTALLVKFLLEPLRRAHNCAKTKMGEYILHVLGTDL